MKLLVSLLTAAIFAFSAATPTVAAEPGELIAVPVAESAVPATPGAHKAKTAKKAIKHKKATRKAVKKAHKRHH